MKQFSFGVLLALLTFSTASFAEVGEVFSFGEGNVMGGSLSNSTELTLQKNHPSEADRYYDFKCKKSGLLKKNHLVFKVVEKSTKTVLIQGEDDVKDCGGLLRDIYRIAFERDAHVVVALTEEADDKGIHGVNVSVSWKVEVVK